jgi:hypothetical protein
MLVNGPLQKADINLGAFIFPTPKWFFLKALKPSDLALVKPEAGGLSTKMVVLILNLIPENRYLPESLDYFLQPHYLPLFDV